MSEEVECLREYLKETIQYKGLQEELTYDVPLEMLKRICVALDYLQQENQQLKEEIKKFQKNYTTKENALQMNKEDLVNMLFASWSRENELYQQLDKYKEVIEEVREFVGSEEMYNCSFEEETNKLLQILDKVD